MAERKKNRNRTRKEILQTIADYLRDHTDKNEGFVSMERLLEECGLSTRGKSYFSRLIHEENESRAWDNKVFETKGGRVGGVKLVDMEYMNRHLISKEVWECVQTFPEKYSLDDDDKEKLMLILKSVQVNGMR